MNIDNEAFLKRLLETFIQEAKEHIDNLSNGLLTLKKSTDTAVSKKIVETLFREAHSFKGASRSVNISEIEEICKAMEDVFSHYKLSDAKISDPLIEAMLECNDLLNLLIQTDETGRRDQKPHVQKVIDTLYEILNEKETAAIPLDTPPIQKTFIPDESEVEQKKIEVITEAVDESPKIAEESKTENETLRISVKKLNAIMHQSEELLFAKIASKRYVDQLKEIREMIDGLKSNDLNALRIQLNHMEKLLQKTIKQSSGDAREIELNVDRLISEMKEALMLPFSAIFYALPKIVHDMAKSQEKESVLNVIGGEMEIDRRILEEMHDPLLHLLRNAVDHGIERPESRIAKGKSPVGTVTLTLHQISATKVELSVSDDGEGIDPHKIAEAALKKNIVNPETLQSLDTQGMLNLVFQSGITTAQRVSDLSGRGLGLAIVQERAEKLGGSVRVENQKEGGSLFSITLPMSMATFRGVVTSQNNQKFIFPSEHIVRVMKIDQSEIKTIEGKEILQIDHHVVPFFLFSSLFELPFLASAKISVIVLNLGSSMMALGVEEIESEEEVMVKSLGKQLLRVKNIAGAALLASDIPALILNISDLFKSVRTASYQSVASNPEVVQRKRRILVADDSPTTRALLQNILEMVGYDVTAAVDGLEAFEILKKESFDIIVTDVDMPRMNGFELTEAVRADTKLSELPIILVTSLENPEDKEKGMHAGANAYIIKSTFDQNNLLETIELLID